MPFLKTTLAAAALALLMPLPGTAQTAWPEKPVNIVVPFPPGGATDVMARMLAPKIEQSIGQTVVIQNKAGAGGSVGTQSVARAESDGYTFLWGTVATHGIGPSVYKKLPYDPAKDFAPVVHVVNQPYVLVVHPSTGVGTLKGFIEKAQANPGSVSVASAGQGTGAHMILEKFQSEVDADFLNVPYKGAGPAMTDLVGGQVQAAFDVILTTVPFIESKRVVPLAVTSDTRSPTLPDVPTLAESGLKGFAAVGWNGLFAPAGTPQAIIDKMNQAVNAALADPQIKERILKDGSIPQGGTPQQFTSFVADELANWSQVARKAGVSLD